MRHENLHFTHNYFFLAGRHYAHNVISYCGENCIVYMYGVYLDKTQNIGNPHDSAILIFL